MIKRSNNTVGLIKTVHGPVIEAMEGIEYKEDKLQLSSNDHIILYTDGVTETMNINKELYSVQRFIQLIERMDNSIPKKNVNDVVEDVLVHTGEAE